ncbi:makorin, ring finger protein, 4 isoform X1 [Osmerus mordax]|uniref:makorin, ring finger protein, 4 isoform X1 n=1 Tax=Osmerus mordax TaxID=8014 RepID=UPI00350FB748
MEQFVYSCRNPYKDSYVGRGICRQFLNGSCTFGSRCHYLHQWPAFPSDQICRYFQKGGCWYGERCRYLHVLQPNVEAVRAERRGSVPAVPSNHWVSYSLPDRRGSEPSLHPGAQEFTSRGSDATPTHVANLQQSFGHLTTNIVEEVRASSPLQQEVESDVTHESAQPTPQTSAQTIPSGSLSASAVNTTLESKQSETPSQEVAEHAGAAAPAGQSQTDAFNQSKDVTCGICMDKVYEKTEVEERRFGILPNCCHSFCLGCIVTWRKTKNFQEEVIKGCPQCRVKSAFYVPCKYWVEGQPKETVIASFKEKCSKRRCSFFMRQGSCPFKRECLYRHELPHGYCPPAPPRRRRLHHAVSLDDLDSLQLLDYVIAMTLLDDLLDVDDDDYNDLPNYDDWVQPFLA